MILIALCVLKSCFISGNFFVIWLLLGNDSAMLWRLTNCCIIIILVIVVVTIIIKYMHFKSRPRVGKSV